MEVPLPLLGEAVCGASHSRWEGGNIDFSC